MDKIFIRENNKDKYFLDCTRLDGLNRVVSRTNPNDLYSVQKEILLLADYLKLNNIKEIILLDDVVFSGNVLKSIIEEFNINDIKVVGIRCSISTIKAFDYFNKTLPFGIKTGFILEENVIDQICERDFYYGIVQSGISVLKENKVLKAPYFLPFGNPNQRASIPKDKEKEFSIMCLENSKLIWKNIEDNANKYFYNKDLPEKICFADDDKKVLDTLEEGIRLCKR